MSNPRRNAEPKTLAQRSREVTASRGHLLSARAFVTPVRSVEFRQAQDAHFGNSAFVVTLGVLARADLALYLDMRPLLQGRREFAPGSAPDNAAMPGCLRSVFARFTVLPA